VLNVLDGVDDERLRLYSARLFVATTVLMVVNVAAYLVHLIGTDDLILVTLVLSWLAIQWTAAQTVIQTDIKKSVDEAGG